MDPLVLVDACYDKLQGFNNIVLRLDRSNHLDFLLVSLLERQYINNTNNTLGPRDEVIKFLFTLRLILYKEDPVNIENNPSK